MDWDAIGAVGEILGAAAVVVTLALLIRQLRQNTESLKIQSLNNVFGEWVAMTGELQTQPELRKAFFNDASGAVLESDERLLLIVYFVRILHENDKVYHLYQQGAADRFTFESIQKTLFDIVGESHFFPDWWSFNKWRYSTAFRELIDKELGNKS